MSVDNAKLFGENLDKPVSGPFHGNKMIKGCAFRSSMWLKTIKDFTVSEEVYKNHFHEPIRLLANFRLDMRHTETVGVFVFSNSSDFYDRYFNCRVQSLGVIIPELGSAMSIRLRSSEAANIKPGSLYTLSSVQPMPYVNRIHPHHIDISMMGGQFPLSKIDSLMTSLDDLELFRTSLAFENFCEIECHQVGRRLLGAPVIVSGYLESIDIPFIYLRGCTGKYVKFYINSRYFETNSGIMIDELHSFSGKPVMLLVVVWYGRRQDDPYPEVFMLEELEDRFDPLYVEVCGYVRMRAPLHVKELNSKFPTTRCPPYDSISVKDGFVDWEPAVNKAIYHEFYTKLRKIRRGLRAGESARELLACSELLLDQTRLEEKKLAERVCTETNLLKSFLRLLMHQDIIGELPQRLTELREIVSGDVMGVDSLRHILWLVYTSLLMRQKRSSVIGSRGTIVLFEAIKTSLVKKIIDIFPQGKGVTIDELARELNLPPSLLFLGLKSLEKDGAVRCLNACELYWASTRLTNSVEIVSEADRVIAEYEKAVLEVLRGVFHPLHSLKVTEILRESGRWISHYSVLKILEKLKSMNVIVQYPDGMWEYPLAQRVRDFLENNPESAYNWSQIVEHMRLPLHLRSELSRVLEELNSKSVVWQPLDGLWAIRPDDEGRRLLQIRSVLLSKAQTHILDILEKNPRAQDVWLFSKTRIWLRPIAEKVGYTADISDIVKVAISKLIAQGTIKVFERLEDKWFFLSARRGAR